MTTSGGGFFCLASQISVNTFTGDWAEVGESIAVDVDELVLGGWNDGYDILARDVVTCHGFCDLVIEEVDNGAWNQVVPVFLDDDLPSSESKRRENKGKGCFLSANVIVCMFAPIPWHSSRNVGACSRVPSLYGWSSSPELVLQARVIHKSGFHMVESRRHPYWSMCLPCRRQHKERLDHGSYVICGSSIWRCLQQREGRKAKGRGVLVQVDFLVLQNFIFYVHRRVRNPNIDPITAHNHSHSTASESRQSCRVWLPGSLWASIHQGGH